MEPSIPGYLPPDKTIERLLTEGDLETALERIGELMKAAEYNQSIWANLQGQYKSAKEEHMKDVLPKGEFERTENRIREQMYSLIRVLTKQIQPYLRFQNTNPFDFTQSNESDYATLREYLISKLEGKYDIDAKPLGEGSTCLIFVATEKNFNRRVVLRILKVANVEAPRQEVVRCLHLKHRNVMMLYEAYFNEFPYFLISEYVNGKCLDDLLVHGRRPFFEAQDWLLQIADAMDYLLEKRIRHTHVRPSKILLDSENQPVISPFEIIRASSPGRTKQKIIQDALYLAPEILDNMEDLDDMEAAGRAEQFSLATLAYEVLTGEPLFAPLPGKKSRHRNWNAAGMSLSNVILARERFFRDREYRLERLSRLQECFCPDALVPLLEQMLDKDPQDRLDDLAEFRRRLMVLDSTVDELQNRVAKSIARCRRFSRDFIGTFYGKVLEDPSFPPSSRHFKSPENQQKMFNGILNLLLEYDRNPEFIQRIAQMEKHTGLLPEHYRTFLDLLIKTVSEFDSHWTKDPEIPLAWGRLRDGVLQQIQNAHQSPH